MLGSSSELEAHTEAPEASSPNIRKKSILRRTKSLGKFVRRSLSFRSVKKTMKQKGTGSSNSKRVRFALRENGSLKTHSVDVCYDVVEKPKLTRSFSERLFQRKSGKMTASVAPIVQVRELQPGGVGTSLQRSFSLQELTSGLQNNEAGDGLILEESAKLEMVKSESCDVPDGPKIRAIQRSYSERLMRWGSKRLRTDENGLPRTMSKKEKYFAQKQDKNIFMKILHPGYHERNQGFKKLFVDKGLVDEAEIFLASYSCAYQREILAQGRMYISQSNVCFYANIIGWETSLVIPMKDIQKVTKEKAAFIFPNSIQIVTKTGEKYFFASFVNRDKSIHILQTALDHEIDGKPMTPEAVWEMFNNSEGMASMKKLAKFAKRITRIFLNTGYRQIENSSSANSPLDSYSISSPTGTPSSMTILNGRKSKKSRSSKKSDKDNSSQGSSSSDFAEEESQFIDENLNLYNDGDSSINTNYEEVKCPCEDHFGRLLLDAVFSISVSKLHEMLFTDSEWFDRFNAALKNRDYAASSWMVDKSGAESRNVTYGVALNHAMAPKNVIVNEKQTISYFPRKEDGIIVFKETQNSGIPYSDNFVVQVCYCISRAGPNECRLKVHGGINYKKGIWSIVKGYIEKGTNQGLDEHFHLLEKMLKEESAEINRLEPQLEPGSFESAASPIQQKISHEINSEIRNRKSRLTAGSENVVPSRRVPEVVHGTGDLHLKDKMDEIRGLLMTLLVTLGVFLGIIVLILWEIRGSLRPQESGIEKEASTDEKLQILMIQIEQLKSQVDVIVQNVQK